MPVTSNPNNNYEVEIIESPDISGLISQPPPVPSFLQIAANGEEFIEWKITPTTIGYPLIASNMRLKGNTSNTSYWEDRPVPEWRPGNMNGNYVGPNPNIQPQADECTPPITPHDLTPTNGPNPMVMQYNWLTGTSCSSQQPGNPWSPGISVYHACQVVRFYHTLLGGGGPTAIGNINIEGIMSEYTIMVEVYEDDNGNLVNDNLTPTNNYLSGTWPNSPSTYMWIQWDAINHAPITNNIYPKYLKCFSFITYNANILNYQAPQILDMLFDLDEAKPVNGCTDPGALNYNPNAIVDDGSCSYLNQQSYQIQLSFDLSTGYSPQGFQGSFLGPYTDGSLYSFTVPFPQNQTFLYQTLDFDAQHGIDQNLRFNNGALTETVMLSNYYNPGDQVSEVVEIYVYPYVDQSGGGPVIYDFPGPGGPNAQFNLPSLSGQSLSDYLDYVQRMYSGWGNTKNNLTAASLRIMFDFVGWLTPDYEDPIVSPTLWITDPDITGLQPSKDITFSQNGALPGAFSEISAHEEYNPTNANPARDYFPNKVKIKFQLDFNAPSPQQNYSGSNPWSNGNLLYTIPISLAHATENQGDLNWVAPI
tara:strand:+ start:458 stop:2224 length:1767 start_codon:yes stop_codon:yes gene_type:complete